MRWIFDANTVIYLTKAQLIERVYELMHHNLVIDTHVYTEVVINGKNKNYPDALVAETFFIKAQIPIIPVDIAQDFAKFRDEGETSCFLLAKMEGCCISSDTKAIKQYQKYKVPIIRIEDYLFYQWEKHNLKDVEYINILTKLEAVLALSPERHLFLIQKMKENIKGEGHE